MIATKVRVGPPSYRSHSDRLLSMQVFDAGDSCRSSYLCLADLGDVYFAKPSRLRRVVSGVVQPPQPGAILQSACNNTPVGACCASNLHMTR